MHPLLYAALRRKAKPYRAVACRTMPYKTVESRTVPQWASYRAAVGRSAPHRAVPGTVQQKSARGKQKNLPQANVVKRSNP